MLIRLFRSATLPSRILILAKADDFAVHSERTVALGAFDGRLLPLGYEAYPELFLDMDHAAHIGRLHLYWLGLRPKISMAPD